MKSNKKDNAILRDGAFLRLNLEVCKWHKNMQSTFINQKRGKNVELVLYCQSLACVRSANNQEI